MVVNGTDLLYCLGKSVYRWKKNTNLQWLVGKNLAKRKKCADKGRWCLILNYVFQNLIPCSSSYQPTLLYIYICICIDYLFMWSELWPVCLFFCPKESIKTRTWKDIDWERGSVMAASGTVGGYFQNLRFSTSFVIIFLFPII